MLHVILIVSILWLWKFFHSCPTVSDLHWKMRLSLVLATLVYNLGLWVCKCHVGSMPIQFFYTNNLFIIKECFWNVEGSWVFGHLWIFTVIHSRAATNNYFYNRLICWLSVYYYTNNLKAKCNVQQLIFYQKSYCASFLCCTLSVTNNEICRGVTRHMIEFTRTRREFF